MKNHNNLVTLILFAGLVLLQISTKGQYIYQIGTNLGIYYGVINNSKSKLKEIPFSHIKILDCRWDSISIGFRKSELLCYTNDTGKRYRLQDFIDAYYNPKCTNSTNDTLILLIEKLSIRHKVKYVDLASDCWQMHCKFYFGKNHSYLLAGNFNHEEFGSKKWEKYMFRMFDDALKEAMTLYKNIPSGVDKKYDPDSLIYQNVSRRCIPILTEKPKAGFYYDFHEFLNNEPGFTYANDSSLSALLELMKYKYFTANQFKKKPKKVIPDTTYWGFCNGKRFYIRNGLNFFQIARCDAVFYFMATFSGIQLVQDERIGNGIVAALLLGLSMAGGSSYAPAYYPSYTTPIPYIEVPFANATTAGYTLDYNTGKIIF